MTRSAVRTSFAPVRLDGRYRFDPVDCGTRFTTRGDMEAQGFFRLAEPVFARMARREWVPSCETIENVLESGAAASVTVRGRGPDTKAPP
jgi:hypothetical protein